MLRPLPIASMQDLYGFGKFIAESQMFGYISEGLGFCIATICYQNNMDILTFGALYDVIEGKIAPKASTLLANFEEAGGIAKHITYTDEEVSIHFDFKDKSRTVTATFKEMCARGIATTKSGEVRKVWQQHRRRMLNARVVTEGIRLVAPKIAKGLYVPEEHVDFTAEDNIPLPEDPNMAQTQLMTNSEFHSPNSELPDPAICNLGKYAGQRWEELSDELLEAGLAQPDTAVSPASKDYIREIQIARASTTIPQE